jgi:hypothetical protein
MFGKSKIRKDFEDAFKSGNEAIMQQLLKENPWLVSEWESKMNGSSSGDQAQILAALGVMEDELCNPVPLDEISFCLRVDFKTKKDENQILSLLSEAETLGYCKKVQNSWSLTPQGGKIADNYLNSHAV